MFNSNNYFLDNFCPNSYLLGSENKLSSPNKFINFSLHLEIITLTFHKNPDMIFNLIGIGEAILSFAIGYGLFGEDSGYTITGFLWIAMDLIYRYVRKEEWEGMPLWSPRRGGQVFFIPGWLCGIGIIFLGLFG
ncbi:MAG: hypothetical protein V3R33_06165 [Anaerolineales bacterium]